MTKTDVTLLYFERNGFIPNNPYLPVLHYKRVLKNNEDKIEKFFLANKWGNTWVNGVFDFHHYHSNSHEVLGIARGSALLLLGGESGTKVIVNSGDVLVLPAGTGHKKLSGSPGFQVVGAYPNGQAYNLKKNTLKDWKESENEIKKTAFPEADPIYGECGPLVKMWRKEGG
ncbi:cupin domain-containing protein [Niallia sp. 03133]|uniref:cupin domain-containing protein n=1 Tax=Niallia sp. 03133 TaxID=3458060 RepID=UPI00404405AF